MKFSNLSLGSKQIIASILILLIMAGVNLFSIWKMASLKESIVAIAGNHPSLETVQDADQTYRKSSKIIILLLGFTTALSLGLAVGMAAYITDPLEKLVEAARQVADGDLKVELEVNSQDEIGSLAQSFNHMTAALRQAEEENRRQALQIAVQEKMASLGNLVAGVAHEVNNPIGAVNSAAQTSDRALALVAEALEQAEDLQALKDNRRLSRALNVLNNNNDLISTAGERIAQIVKSLKEFSRLDEAEFQLADVHQGLDSTIALLDHQLKDRVQVVRQYGDLPQILCYPNQLNQVFMNVLANALEAIEGPGTITITTAQETEHVRITIADTGKGIPDQDLERIYEPGFTSKGVGVGIGLGLSISHNIVHRHQGHFQVETQVNQGTDFSILLPVELDPS